MPLQQPVEPEEGGGGGDEEGHDHGRDGAAEGEAAPAQRHRARLAQRRLPAPARVKPAAGAHPLLRAGSGVCASRLLHEGLAQSHRRQQRPSQRPFRSRAAPQGASAAPGTCAALGAAPGSEGAGAGRSLAGGGSRAAHRIGAVLEDAGGAGRRRPRGRLPARLSARPAERILGAYLESIRGSQPRMPHSTPDRLRPGRPSPVACYIVHVTRIQGDCERGGGERGREGERAAAARGGCQRGTSAQRSDTGIATGIAAAGRRPRPAPGQADHVRGPRAPCP